MPQISEIERAVMHGEKMPKNLNLGETAEFIGLYCLYWGVHNDVFNRETASDYKKRLLSVLGGIDENREKERRVWEGDVERTIAVDRALQKYIANRTIENADDLAGQLEWIHNECSVPVVLIGQGAKCPNCGKYFNLDHMHRKPNFCEDCGCKLEWPK